MWTHGPHAYNESSIEDIELLNYWNLKKDEDVKNNKLSFYEAAIHTWTVLDPLKRSLAYKNGLNYLEFWDIIKVKEYFKKYEKN